MEAISKSAESGTEEVSNKELKPWQKGFELDYLKELEKRFNSYNEYAQHELSKFKKNKFSFGNIFKPIIEREYSRINTWM